MTIGIVDDLVWVTIQIQGVGEREVVNEVLIKVGRGERNCGHSQIFAASFLRTTTLISKYLLLSFPFTFLFSLLDRSFSNRALQFGCSLLSTVLGTLFEATEGGVSKL